MFCTVSNFIFGYTRMLFYSYFVRFLSFKGSDTWVLGSTMSIMPFQSRERPRAVATSPASSACRRVCSSSSACTTPTTTSRAAAYHLRRLPDSTPPPRAPWPPPPPPVLTSPPRRLPHGPVPQRSTEARAQPQPKWEQHVLRGPPPEAPR